MTKISLQREEKLAICVQKYPALYNKAEPSFHNKNEKANAWSKIAFLFWLGNFIYERKGRSNLPQEESIDCDENISKETLCESEDNTESFDKDEDAISTTDVQTISTSQQLINQDSGNITPDEYVVS